MAGSSVVHDTCAVLPDGVATTFEMTGGVVSALVVTVAALETGDVLPAPS